MCNAVILKLDEAFANIHYIAYLLFLGQICIKFVASFEVDEGSVTFLHEKVEFFLLGRLLCTIIIHHRRRPYQT